MNRRQFLTHAPLAVAAAPVMLAAGPSAPEASARAKALIGLDPRVRVSQRDVERLVRATYADYERWRSAMRAAPSA